MLELYTFAGSTCSQAVRFCLAEKAIVYHEIRLVAAKGEHLTPDYLKLNPNGVVPTLVDDGEPVTESTVIMEYLEEVFPEPSLTFDDPLRRARLRVWLRYLEEVPTPAIRYPSFQMVLFPRMGPMTSEQRRREAERRPLREFFYKQYGDSGFPQALVDQALKELRQSIERVDDALAAHGGPWIMGERLTIADACLLPIIDRLDDLGLAEMWADRPRLAGWYGRMRERPAYKAAFYPGARLSEAAVD